MIKTMYVATISTADGLKRFPYFSDNLTQAADYATRVILKSYLDEDRAFLSDLWAISDCARDCYMAGSLETKDLRPVDSNKVSPMTDTGSKPRRIIRFDHRDTVVTAARLRVIAEMLRQKYGINTNWQTCLRYKRDHITAMYWVMQGEIHIQNTKRMIQHNFVI